MVSLKSGARALSVLVVLVISFLYFSSSSTHMVLPESKPDTLFVAVVDYAGQQGSGARSLSSFQSFLTSLHGNTVIAEPKFKNSRLYGYIDSALNFSSFLDFDFFNKQSRKIGYPVMISLTEFTNRSPRYAVYVHIRALAKGSVQSMV